MQQKNRTSGFASMDQQKQREIARKGGMAAHIKGTAHEFTADEARNAGRKGGQSVSANRSHMIEIGRLGGKRSAQRRRSVIAAQNSSPAPTASQPREVTGQEMADMEPPVVMETSGETGSVMPPSEEQASHAGGHQTM